MYPTEKNSQHISNPLNPYDSGFVSRACSDYDSDYSMRVAHQPVYYDNVKDLQADFAGINDFDAVTRQQHRQRHTRFNISRSDANKQATIDELLLQYFEQDDEGETQLHVSVYNAATARFAPEAEKAARIACWLIDKVPQLDMLDLENDEYLTALHIATIYKHAGLVRCLVLGGADTTIVTSNVFRPWTAPGNAAIHMACEANDYRSVRALTEPLSQEELKYLAFNNKTLPVLGQDLELRNYHGVTPMHVAIKRGNLEIVKQLIKVGAEVNTADPCSGYTSLHIAINYNQRHIVEYMATYHNSCINVPTRFGMYTYEIALNVNPQLANDLVRWGAAPIIAESDSDSYSESESEESLDDEEPEQYLPAMISYSDMYQDPVDTGTFVTA